LTASDGCAACSVRTSALPKLNESSAMNSSDSASLATHSGRPEPARESRSASSCVLRAEAMPVSRMIASGDMRSPV
jgi:hypothetical protein